MVQISEAKNLLKISLDAQRLLETAADKLDLSARSYLKTLRVARTIADIEASREILPQHVSESLQYRYKQEIG